MCWVAGNVEWSSVMQESYGDLRVLKNLETCMYIYIGTHRFFETGDWLRKALQTRFAITAHLHPRSSLKTEDTL